MSMHSADWQALGTKTVEWAKANPLVVAIFVTAIATALVMWGYLG